MSLANDIRQLQGTEVKKRIDARLKGFRQLAKAPERDWFSELCFCILTANSKGRTAYNIQEELGAQGFSTACLSDIRDCIIRHKHRFHNNKARYIMEARKFVDIKKRLEGAGQKEARKWLVSNVKGIGYKEASHFLRNVGFFDLAILDRHILNLMLEHGLIDERPKALSKAFYLKAEDALQKLADELGMRLGELDMYLWHMKTGDVLK